MLFVSLYKEVLAFESVDEILSVHHSNETYQAWAQLFEGRLALNLGLKLTLISFSCVQKHFPG